MTNITEQIAQLRDVIPQLDERSQGFATSLCDQFAAKGLSDKQSFWVGKLIERATRTEPEPTTVGDVSGIVALLDRAKTHLKRPALLVRAQERDFRLNIAEKGKMPGSINVTSIGRWGDREWFGRITREGEWLPSQRYDAETQTAIGLALQAMATDPAKAAGEYGRLTGACCFCSLPLTDERSTTVGYGRICAGHYGLPWGAREKADG